MIAKARGDSEVTDDDLTQFKTAVARVLSRYASGILIDPEYGLPALKAKDPRAGVLLAYEKTGYDATMKGRLPDLLPEWSARRLVAAGADAIKILLYYNPADELKINTIKHAFIERVAAECIGIDVPLFLETITYDDALDEKGPEYAKHKPELVKRSMAEFTKPQYGVDVLKVEIPVNMTFVEGTRAFKGQAAYSRQEALRFFGEAARVATKPFIYLSAGVSDEVFRESIELAGEAGVAFAGVLSGHANWQDSVPAYAKGGVDGLLAWLEDRGVQNITSLNAVLAKAAKPWWDAYGGREQIEVVASSVPRTM